MTQTISVSKGQKSAQYQIENTSKSIIPVTVKVFKRIQNQDGTEKLPKTTLIRVFPPQLIISPGERKTIRVDWLGKSDLNEEQAFRVVAEQVPLKLNKKKGKDKGGIKMLLKYVNALYVNPKDTEANLHVISYTVTDKLRVFIRNNGNKHKYLKNIKLSFKSKDKIYKVSKLELKKLDGQNILAKTTRYFDFNFKNKIPVNLKASIKVE